MRRVFCNIIYKKIYSFPFQRSSGVNSTVEDLEKLLHKLKRAQSERSIVVAAPESIKSMFLVYIDLMQRVAGAYEARADAASNAVLAKQRDTDAHSNTECRAVDDIETQKAEILKKIMLMWGTEQRGIVLLDEVDILLNPLKSELNFPIGDEVSNVTYTRSRTV